jgi:hypothetical protein
MLSATMTAAHRQVELALRPGVMQQHLNPLHARHAGKRTTRLACHVLDAKYEPGKQCSVLYQLGDQLMIGELHWPAPEQPMPEQPAMELYPFEQDPALPALTTVQDGSKMAAILSQALPECVNGAQRILRCKVTPLRYRLGKRYTLRFDVRLRNTQSGAITARTFFGKLYHSSRKAQAVYGEMQMLSAAPTLRAGGLQVAQAVAYLPELPLILQAPVSGVPLDLLLSLPKATVNADNTRLIADIQRAAVALATLHQVEASTDRLRPVADELVRFQQRSAQIMRVDPATGTSLHDLARALPAWQERLATWGAESTLVHGDCKPSQFFVGDERVALLDFDHCGMADPAADVGNFLATLRQQGVGLALKERKESAAVATTIARLALLEEAFLTAYMAARGCPPAFRWRATWYQAETLLRKALRSFSRSTRSPLPARLVQEAWRCLATLPAA